MISNMDTIQDSQPLQELASAWGFQPKLVVCDQCGWGFLAQENILTSSCPHCFKTALSILENPQEALDQGLPFNQVPELVLPFTLTQEKLAANIQSFSQGIPYPPVDLQADSLAKRLQRIFIPVWLVDASVCAGWQGEAGFNYEVVSHQEKFSQNQGGWKSQAVTETRVRWEPRKGRLDRVYHNNPVTALEGEDRLKKILEKYRLDDAQAYTPESALQTFVRVPDRNPEDAWRELLPGLQTAAAEDCRRAAAADHLRDFRWQPDFYARDWTLMLLPLYATYYLDDENQPQAVYLDGQTGIASGERRASPKRARRTGLFILAAAGLILLISLLLALAGLLVTPLLAISGVGLIIALLVGIAAIIPTAIAWQFNRSRAIPSYAGR